VRGDQCRGLNHLRPRGGYGCIEPRL